MKRITVFLIVLLLLLETASMAAVRGDTAMYVGGTLSAIPEKTQGHLDLTGETAAKFTAKNADVAIPYAKITSLEYGQKAGRRVGAALAVTPFLLFSKKRKHYLTVGFTDDQGKQQGAVFELSKGTVRNILNVLETRSGKKVEYESEEAKKHAGN